MVCENREVELKFDIDPERLDALVTYLSPGDEPVARNLKSIYFDTPDQSLRKAGFTLRVRKERRRWTQTLKSSAAPSGTGQREWEAPVKGGAPDADPLRATPVAEILKGLALEPLFTVSVERRSVTLSEAGSTVEASLDKGEVTRAGRSVAFDELELELKSGDRAMLFAFAGKLRRAFALRPGFNTEADRGFVLMDKKGPPGRRFRAPALRLGMTADVAFKVIAVAALEQIAGNAEEFRERPDGEVIHQMRVGARRLRSTLSTFKSIVSDRRIDGVKAGLKWLLGELDSARNLDVFLSGAFARASRARLDKEDLSALGERLRMARKAAYAKARTVAEGDRFSALLFDILTWIEVGPWTEAGGKTTALRNALIGEFAPKALEAASLKAKKRARRFDHLSRETRHQLRIRIKTLRYIADVFGDLFTAHPKRSRRFVRRIKALANCLGELNDIATGEDLMADGPKLKRMTDRQTSREKQLIDSAGDAVAAFGKTKRFWPK